MSQMRISHNIMDRYASYLMFECTFHNVHIYPTNGQGDTLVLLIFHHGRRHLASGC
jgi:hypothetical protein